MGVQQMRVGVLGAGFISDYHIAGLQEAGANVVSIFSRTHEKAQEKAQRYGIAHFTTDYQEILDRDDVEAVIIATPDFTHEEIAVSAARAGKPSLIQKPMARNSQECLHIIEAAEKGGVPVYVSWMHRYLEEVVKLRELLADRILGRIFLVRQRNATPGAPLAWFYSKEKVGGGALLQLGIHGIDLLRYLFGEIEAVKATTALMKERVTLADGSVITPEGEDMILAIYRFASGAIAVHETAWNEAAGTDRFRTEIYGERGTVWLRTERGLLSLYAPDYVGLEGWFEPDLPKHPFGWRQHRHFLAMVRGEEPPDSSARDGLASILVAEAIYRSNDSDNWEEVRRP